MKIRAGFVTNSSSSSFICVAKVKKNKELLDFFKEEYGKYGLRLLDEYLFTGKQVKENDICDFENFLEYCREEGIEIPDDELFLSARFISWTNDGDTEGDDAWLYEHIPDKYMEEIYDEND